MKTKTYRQGDILLVSVDAIPENAKQIVAEKRYILAEGEATGHAHAIAVQSGVTAHTLVDDLFIQTEMPVKVTHEEHDTITLSPGTWRVVRQAEYAPDAIRRVLD